MNEELFFIECDEGKCTILFKKPYLVDISEEAQYVIVMEIGYKEENSADEYYFTKDEAIAMAKNICFGLEREYKEGEKRMIQELNDGTWKNFEP